ncbi:hypothetical protein AAEU29_07100 [Pseudoalteromonas sp. SSM20]|uniref:hypothetical protein n=1 Tax=Pseudoalteromonas sp. SSM20 TaxID=3139394 RepID=UPI003BAB7BE7
MKLLFLLLCFPLSLLANQCGTDMDTSLVGGGCVCPIGKDWRYGKCVSNGLPEFAIDDAKGGWQCIDGYVKKGTHCEKYVVPIAQSKLLKVAAVDCNSNSKSSRKCKLPKQFQNYLSNKQKTQP